MACSFGEAGRAAPRSSDRPARPGRAPCRPDRSLGALGNQRLLSVGGRTASKSRSRKRFMSGRRISAMRASRAWSRKSGRSLNSATTSIVRSSAVGPRPPLVITRSTPCRAMKASWARMSAGRSPQIVMWASSMPSSSRRSDSQGPFRSCTRPVSTSVPVTTIPARAATRKTRPGPFAHRQRPARPRAEAKPRARRSARWRGLPLRVISTEVFPRLPAGACRGRSAAR